MSRTWRSAIVSSRLRSMVESACAASGKNRLVPGQRSPGLSTQPVLFLRCREKYRVKFFHKLTIAKSLWFD